MKQEQSPHRAIPTIGVEFGGLVACDDRVYYWPQLGPERVDANLNHSQRLVAHSICSIHLYLRVPSGVIRSGKIEKVTYGRKAQEHLVATGPDSENVHRVQLQMLRSLCCDMAANISKPKISGEKN